MEPLGLRVGSRVEYHHHPDFPDHPVVWRAYQPAEWWARASTGMDYHGCRTAAWVDGDGILVQHGPDPEAARWFGLDELNGVGRPLRANPTTDWYEEIHRVRD